MRRIALRRPCSAQALGGDCATQSLLRASPGRPSMATRGTHASRPWPPVRRMRRTLFSRPGLALAGLLLCVTVRADGALHSLWELHGKHNTVYLLGSIHVLRLSRSEEHTSELQSHLNLVCRLLLEKKKKHKKHNNTLTM